MEWLIFIFLLALVPSLVAFILVRREKQRFNERMRRIRRRYQYYQPVNPPLSSLDRYQKAIGDTTCCYNAHSAYLRCAVNPSGPCEDCPFYQKR